MRFKTRRYVDEMATKTTTAHTTEASVETESHQPD